MKYYLAADGGGTKLQAILYDENLHILSTARMAGTTFQISDIDDKLLIREEKIMRLINRYQQAVFELLKKVQDTQAEAIQKAGEMVANVVEQGHKVYITGIVHGIEGDLLGRGGGPVLYQEYKKDETRLQAGDMLFIASISGRSAHVVDLVYDSVQAGVKVAVLTSREYSDAVGPVHVSGRKLYEIATLTLDVCSPAGEAMLEVEGLDAKFGASSGISSVFLLWSMTAVAVEKLMEDGYTPGIFRSQNFPGGSEYNEAIRAHYAEYGW